MSEQNILKEPISDNEKVLQKQIEELKIRIMTLEASKSYSACPYPHYPPYSWPTYPTTPTWPPQVCC